MNEVKKPRKGLKLGPLLLLFVIIIAIWGIYDYQKNSLSGNYSPPTPTIPSKPSPSSLFQVKINKFSVGEYNYYEVVGEVKNISSRPYKFVEVKAHFLDTNGNIVGDETAYACGTDYILPGATKSFKFMGENQPNYKRVSVEVIDFSEID